MTFDKAAIIFLAISNIMLLWTNRQLSDLVKEACELIEKINDLNLKLFKLIGRNDQ